MIRDLFRQGVWRKNFVLFFFIGCGGYLILHAFFLQYHDTDFFQTESGKRHTRNIEIPAVRGTIYDRNGETIASSAQMSSVWADPSILSQYPHYFPRLAEALNIPLDQFTEHIAKYHKHRFIWLKRLMTPNRGIAIKNLDIPGVDVQKEYKRYYPHTEITSHLLGFTDIDDMGIEGVEKSYNDWLMGESDYKRVIKDSRGRIVDVLDYREAERKSKDLILTIDHRIQIIAYDALKKAVEKHQAKGGSIVVSDARSGEILAIVNQPAGNPNRVSERKAILLKNKALTDLFEPGSTIKPFIVALGLESGKWTANTRVETGGGFRVRGHLIRDVSRSQSLDVTGILTKSSNIGVARIALSLDPQLLWDLYSDLEIGQKSHLKLIGEPTGHKGDFRQWQRNDFEYATKSFGYGFNINAVKLNQIYSVFVNGGVYQPLKVVSHEPTLEGKRIFSQEVANQVLLMLEKVVDKDAGGSGWRAAVPKYRIAGKSGTVQKPSPAGYSDKVHQSYFVGLAPVSDPRYVVTVVIDEPREGGYYGGLIAAPVVSEVLGNTLRILGVRPDAMTDLPKLQLISQD